MGVTNCEVVRKYSETDSHVIALGVFMGFVETISKIENMANLVYKSKGGDMSQKYVLAFAQLRYWCASECPTGLICSFGYHF